MTATPFHGSDLEKIEQLYGIPKEKITVISDIGETVSWLSENAEGEILAITCFSDKGKFLSHVQTQKEAKS